MKMFPNKPAVNFGVRVMTKIRDAIENDFKRIVELNEIEQQQTSQMSLQRFMMLEQISDYCKVATVEGEVAGFLLAFRQGAAYESENFEWFSGQLPDFVYVDRIVVSAKFSGRGLGSKLYTDLFAFAAAHEVNTIVCEYNIVPPNLASHHFHEKFGFKELGTQWVANNSKQVSLQALEI
jgi:predicted GNAT superfamily acetyltransferase